MVFGGNASPVSNKTWLILQQIFSKNIMPIFHINFIEIWMLVLELMVSTITQTNPNKTFWHLLIITRHKYLKVECLTLQSCQDFFPPSSVCTHVGTGRVQFFCRGFRVGIRFTYKGHNLSKVYQLAYYQFCIAQFQNISIPPTEGIEMSLGGRGTLRPIHLKRCI